LNRRKDWRRAGNNQDVNKERINVNSSTQQNRRPEFVSSQNERDAESNVSLNSSRIRAKRGRKNALGEAEASHSLGYFYVNRWLGTRSYGPPNTIPALTNRSTLSSHKGEYSTGYGLAEKKSGKKGTEVSIRGKPKINVAMRENCRKKQVAGRETAFGRGTRTKKNHNGIEEKKKPTNVRIAG